MANRVTATAQRIGFAPITRIDTAKREIEVTATSETLDAYGTIFAYEASQAAFERWLGNVREMHATVAVGKRVDVAYDPERRQVRVRLRISTGAPSTWDKILDGTLCGASIGAANVCWQDMPREQLPDSTQAQGDLPATVRVATAYDLVELSLVDSPANPDCVGITLVRAAVPDVTMLDPLDDADAPPAVVDTIIPLDEPPLHAGMRAMRMACGCALCRADLAGVEDGAATTSTGEASRLWLAETRRMAATVAALHGTVERVAREQREQLAAIAARVALIEQQPMPGGPVLRAAEKTLGFAGTHHLGNLAERITALQDFGATATDQHTQVEVAAEILRLQRGE